MAGVCGSGARCGCEGRNGRKRRDREIVIAIRKLTKLAGKAARHKYI